VALVGPKRFRIAQWRLDRSNPWSPHSEVIEHRSRLPFISPLGDGVFPGEACMRDADIVEHLLRCIVSAPCI